MTVLTKFHCENFPFSHETMADWLHCNTCYKQPGDGRNYFLTNCGHLFCEKCQSKGWKEKCLLCGTLAPSALKLTSKLTPTVDAYFTEPLKMMKQIYAEMKQLIATSEFQHHQRKRFITQLQKSVANQKAVVEQHEKELKANVRNMLEAKEREIHKLREENSYLKRLISERGHGLRSPSASDRFKTGNSPGQKGFGSPSSHLFISGSASTSSVPVQKKISPCGAMTVVTAGRISLRTPPSGGRMGVIPSTPSPQQHLPRQTPKSVPHPISFDVHMETPPR